MTGIASAFVLIWFCLVQDDKAIREAVDRLDDPSPKARVDAQSLLLKSGAKSAAALKARRSSAAGDLAFRLDVLIAAVTGAHKSFVEEDLRKSYWQRGAAARLETIKLLGAMRAADALIELGTGENDADLRASIVRALRVAPRAANEKFLLDRFGESDRAVKAEALAALAELGKCTVDHVREAMREVRDDRVHQAVAQSLYALKDEEVAGLVPDLLKNGAPTLQAVGLDALRRKRIAGWTKEVLELSASSRDRGVRRRAFETLLELRTEESAEALAHLSTWNNPEDRTRVVEAIVGASSLKPIAVLLERLRASEERRDKKFTRREDAVHTLKALARMLAGTQPLPAPIPHESITVRAEPEDPKDSRRVCDGDLRKERAWTHKRGIALVLDLGKTQFVHSLVRLSNGGAPLLLVSEDGEAYARGNVLLGGYRPGEHAMIERRARWLKLDPAQGWGSHPAEPAIREVIVFALHADGVLEAWEAWWKGLEPRLAGYDGVRDAIVEIREKMAGDPKVGVALADKLVERAPALYVSYQARMEARLLAGDIEGAVADGEKALELAPEAVGLHARIGQAHLASKRWGQALESARRTLSAAPGDPDAHFVAACALAASGDRKAALQHLVNAVVCGFSDRKRLESDPVLQPLREDEVFADIVEIAR